MVVVVGGGAVVGGCRKEEEIRDGDKNLCKNNRATQSLNLQGRANRNQPHDIGVASCEPIISSGGNGKECVEQSYGAYDYALDMRKFQPT